VVQVTAVDDPARQRARDRLLRVLLVLVLAPFYARDLASDSIGFGDETYWTAHGFKAAQLLFVRRDLEHPFWSYGRDARVLEKTELPFFLMPPTRVPKLGLLLIGSSVLILDAPAPRPRPYDYFRSVAWNRERGNLPPHATLFAARLPSAVFGILGALCLYSVLRSLLPPGWALAGSLLFGLNPLIHWFSRLATTDVIANSFSIAAILFGIRACQRPDRWAPVLLAGVFACAAVSSKLNAGILVPVLGAAFLIEAWLRREPRLLLRAAASAALAALLFVALNPTLYPDPLGGVLSLLRVGSEFGDLKVMASIGQLDTVSARVQAACQMLLGGAGMLASRLHAPLDHLLLPVGLALLAWRARRLAAARVVLLWLLAALAAVSLWPPMRFERYYIPAIAPIAVAECLALALLLGLAVRGGERAWRAFRARDPG
jgi:hypothetical protein